MNVRKDNERFIFFLDLQTVYKTKARMEWSQPLFVKLFATRTITAAFQKLAAKATK